MPAFIHELQTIWIELNFEKPRWLEVGPSHRLAWFIQLTGGGGYKKKKLFNHLIFEDFSYWDRDKFSSETEIAGFIQYIYTINTLGESWVLQEISSV